MASDHLPLVADFKYVRGIARPRETPRTELVREG